MDKICIYATTCSDAKRQHMRRVYVCMVYSLCVYRALCVGLAFIHKKLPQPWHKTDKAPETEHQIRAAAVHTISNSEQADERIDQDTAQVSDHAASPQQLTLAAPKWPRRTQ